MKNLLFIVLFILVGCNSKSALDLNKHLTDRAQIIDEILVLNEVNGHTSGKLIEYDRIKFMAVLDSHSWLKFISTYDANFKTQEGVSINQTYSDIRSKILKQQFITGWGFELSFKSGWFAVVSNEAIFATKKIIDTSKIVMLYKPSILN